MSIYCWLHVCISWYSEEKRTIQNFIRLYCSFSCCVFLSGDCLYYTEMYRTVGLLESIMDSSGSAAYSLCRNLLIKKVGASRPRQYILLIFIAAVLAFCGTGLNKDGFYKKVQNVQKIPDEVVSICNLINEQKEENEEIYLATDDKIASYVRVYDPSIKMPYGRGGKGASGKKAARWLHKQLVAEVPVIKKVVKNAKRLKCNYLVFPVPSKKKQLYMETKGFYLIGQVNEYGIFKYYE